MKPVYITKASFDPKKNISVVPCGAGMLSCLTGLTVDHWMDRIVNFRKRNKRYTQEYTHFYSRKSRYWSDKHTLYFTEAMHFLKPYNPKGIVEFTKARKLRSLLRNYCQEDKTYVVWFNDPGHIAIIHNKEYWDNDSDGIQSGAYNVWNSYNVKIIAEITPKMHDKMEPFDCDGVDITPSDWTSAALAA